MRRLSGSAGYGFVREAALVAAAMLAYFGIRNQTVGGVGEAFANARRIVDLEQSLHVAWEESIQAAIVGSDVAVTLANWVYIWGHWPVILGVRPPSTSIGAIATTSCAMRCSSRARSASSSSPSFPSRHRAVGLGLVDTVTNESSSYRALQPPGLTNQYAAFPSLHFGWNVVVGIVLLLTTAHLASGCSRSSRRSRWGSRSSRPRTTSSSTWWAARGRGRRAGRRAALTVAAAATLLIVGRMPAARANHDGRHPFLVAHRAGNRLADLKSAEELGVGLVEADVRSTAAGSRSDT